MKEIMEPLLKVENLQVNYQDEEIVRDISFQMDRGEILGIVGESGCGKSTLLDAVLRMLDKEGCTFNGRIIYDGINIASCSGEQMRKIRGNRLGIVFQNPRDSLNPSRTLETQFIETIRAHHKVSKKEACKKAIKMLENLKLKHAGQLLKKYPFQLSGGMNQRAVLALSMVMEPELLLADEPTSALDVTVQAKVLTEMLALREQFGTSILIVTHNMGVISYMADTVAVMYAGQIVEYGDKRTVLKSTAHPYTQALMKATPVFDGEIPKGLSGRPPAPGEKTKGCAFALRCSKCNEKCREMPPKYRQADDGHWYLCHRETGRDRVYE